MEVSLILRDPPQAQGRPRFCSRGSRAFVFDPHKDKKSWCKLQLSEQYKGDTIDAPMHVNITFNMPIPKSTSKKKRLEMIEDNIKHIKKPDLDNLVKFTLDCMNNIIFRDDSQIYRLNIDKKYSESPGTEINISY